MKADSTKSLNLLMGVVKINDIYMFDNGEHTDGSGCLGQYRIKYDTYVIPNGLDNKIDSVFVAY